MKFLSDNLLVLIFAFVLGLSPIQSISASASKCMAMDSSMHTQMMSADSAEKMGMTDSAATEDFCKSSGCDMTHCSNITAAINPDNFIHATYALNKVYQKPAVRLISFYPSSIYRPPKV